MILAMNEFWTDLYAAGGFWLGVAGLLVGVLGFGYTIYQVRKTKTAAMAAREAAEKAFDDYGKKSIFGRDKGKEAEHKFTAAFVHAVLALERIGKIRDSENAEESFTALQNAMSLVKEAYPNWPRAYKYWDNFYSWVGRVSLIQR